MKIEEKKYIDTIFFKYVKNDKYDRNVSVIRFRKLNHRGIVFPWIIFNRKKTSRKS